MNMDRHDREMRLFRRIFWTIFIGSGFAVVGMMMFQMWALYYLASNPEAAGEFVGQIIRGMVNEVSR